MSSYPTRAMLSGTRIRRAVISWSTPSASRSFAHKTAVGLVPAGSSASAAPACCPAATFRAGVSITCRPSPVPLARCSARRAPSRRSATCRMLIGPPTNAIRLWPVSSRCDTARSPPSTSSTDTEHWPPDGDLLSTRTTGVPLRCSRVSRSSAPDTGVINGWDALAPGARVCRGLSFARPSRSLVLDNALSLKRTGHRSMDEPTADDVRARSRADSFDVRCGHYARQGPAVLFISDHRRIRHGVSWQPAGPLNVSNNVCLPARRGRCPPRRPHLPVYQP